MHNTDTKTQHRISRTAQSSPIHLEDYVNCYNDTLREILNRHALAKEKLMMFRGTMSTLSEPSRKGEGEGQRGDGPNKK